jgi:hypothetical protein
MSLSLRQIQVAPATYEPVASPSTVIPTCSPATSLRDPTADRQPSPRPSTVPLLTAPVPGSAASLRIDTSPAASQSSLKDAKATTEGELMIDSVDNIRIITLLYVCVQTRGL